MTDPLTDDELAVIKERCDEGIAWFRSLAKFGCLSPWTFWDKIRFIWCSNWNDEIYVQRKARMYCDAIESDIDRLRAELVAVRAKIDAASTLDRMQS